MDRFYIIPNLLKDGDYAITNEIKTISKAGDAAAIRLKKTATGTLYRARSRMTRSAGSCWAGTGH